MLPRPLAPASAALGASVPLALLVAAPASRPARCARAVHVADYDAAARSRALLIGEAREVARRRGHEAGPDLGVGDPGGGLGHGRRRGREAGAAGGAGAACGAWATGPATKPRPRGAAPPATLRSRARMSPRMRRRLRCQPASGTLMRRMPRSRATTSVRRAMSGPTAAGHAARSSARVCSGRPPKIRAAKSGSRVAVEGHVASCSYVILASRVSWSSARAFAT